MKRMFHILVKFLGAMLREQERPVTATADEWAALFANPAFWAVRSRAMILVEEACAVLEDASDLMVIHRAQGVVRALGWLVDDEQTTAVCGGEDSKSTEAERKAAMECVRAAFAAINKEVDHE